MGRFVERITFLLPGDVKLLSNYFFLAFAKRDESKAYCRPLLLTSQALPPSARFPSRLSWDAVVHRAVAVEGGGRGKEII